MSDRRKLFLWGLALGCLLALTSLPGCSRSDQSAPITTGRVQMATLLQAELMGAHPGMKVGAFPFTPDTSYATVNSAWLPGFYERWKADIFKKGVVKWDERFDCNRFAASYAAAAQIEYFVATFQSWRPAQALAVGEVWFTTRLGVKHSIVIAHTERGPIFIEPQTGEEVRMTPAELASIEFKRF